MALGPSVSCVIELSSLIPKVAGQAATRRCCCKNGKVGISYMLTRLSLRDATFKFITNFANSTVRGNVHGSEVVASFVGLRDKVSEVGVGVGTNIRARVGYRKPRVDRNRLRELFSGVSEVSSNSAVMVTKGVPGAVPSSICREVLREVGNGSMQVMISTAGGLLLGTLGCGPFLVGPGERRLSRVFKIRVGARSSVRGCTGRLRGLNTGGILVSLNNSKTVLVSRFKGERGTKILGRGMVGAINSKSSVMTNFITKCRGAGDCPCTLGLNDIYKGTATFLSKLTAGRGVGRLLTGFGWGKRGGVHVASLLGGSNVTLNIGITSGDRTVSGLISLRRGYKGLGSIGTCGRKVLGHRRLNAATMNVRITVPRTGDRTMGTPTLATVAIPSNISCSSPSNRPYGLLFVVTTAASNSIRLRILTELVRLLVRRSFATGLGITGAPRRFVSVVSTGRGRGFPSRPGTRIPTGGNCEILTVATYPANVTRACVTTRSLRGTNSDLGVPVGIRAGNSNNTGGILARRRVTGYSNIVVTTSVAVGLTHFSNGPILRYTISSNVRGPRRLVGGVMGGRIPMCRRGNNSTSTPGEENNTCNRLVGNMSRVLPFIMTNNVFVTVTFLVSVTYNMGTRRINDTFNAMAPTTT